MRSITSLAFATLFTVLATGCPGPGDDGSDPDDLVGTWRQLPTTTDDPGEIETLTIAADGTYSRSDPGGVLDTGTYAADRERVTIHASANGETHDIDEGYLIAGDQLAVGTLVPDGEADGLVGAWHGEIHQDGEDVEVDLDLRADHTVTYSFHSTEEGDRTVEGTWSDVDDELSASFELSPGATVTIHSKYIAGRAVADKLYQRQ